MDAENVLRQIATTIHQALSQPPVNVPDDNDSADEFVTPIARRFPLPTLHTAIVEPPPKRRCSSANKLIINSCRKVALRTKSFDVMCLPYQKGDCFPFPRGATRQMLVKQKLIAKVTIHSQMSEFEVKNELSSVFAQCFCNNPLEFDFHFLRLGQEFELTDDTLNVPPLSIIDSGEETDILSEVINSPVELLQSIKLDLEKTCNIYIRRSYVLEDFRRASLRKDFYPCRKLHVQFMGEPGIDVGGLTKEFLDILSRKICTWHVFTGNTGSLTLSASVLSLMQELPYSAGVAVGIILCHLKTAVPIFSESLIRHIAGSNNFSIEDIPENEEIKKVLSKLQNNEELISCNEIAAIQNELDYFKDLKNINNKKEFISLACRYFCSVKNGAHIAQFIKGLQQTKVADLIKGHPDVMVKLLTGSKFEQKGMDANVIYETLNFSYSAEGSNLYQHEQNASYYLLQFLMDCCCSNGIHSPNGSAVATAVTEIPLSLHLKDPEDVIVGRGQPATLKCEAKSSALGPDVSWSWQYEGNPILANDSRRQTLADGSLFIPKVAAKRMEGQYRCLARNSVGAVLSNPAKLKIATIGREFIEQPKNVSVAEQQPVVLPCRIQSTPNAVVHWERDNKPLPHSTRYVPLPLGALLITSTHSSDAGFYRCIATNKILNKKTKRSKPGQLTVLPPPRSIEPPKFLPLGLEPNVTILVGSNLTLYCAVTGWPQPTIQWLYNMSFVVGNSSVLDVRNVSGYAIGNYSCSAYNSGGHISMHYLVQVEEPPHFNVTPVSISYPSAKTVRLDCQAKGIPQPEISWLKNGEVLQTVGRIKLQPSRLVLSHSFTTDAGVYQCVAANSAGRAWVSAQLVPYFSENRPSPPQNVQCRPFDDNSICLIWNTPANVTIQAYSIYAFRAVPTVGVGIKDFVTNYTYQLASGLDSSTNYTFYVRSYSKEASDQSNNVSCETGVKGKRNLKVECISETSVKLSWSEISNDIPCGSTSTLYKVQWRRVDQSSVNVEHSTGFKKVVSGLRPSTTYEFRVQSTAIKTSDSAWVSFTLSNNKSSSEIVTTSDYSGMPNELNDTLAAPFTPQQVEADPLSPYSINLTWMNAEEDEEVIFIVCYVEVKDDKSCEKGQLVKSENNYLEVTSLKPNTMYEFKVRAQSFNGVVSPFSHSVQVQTFVDIPSPVQDLKYRVINATTVCVRWQAPLHKNGKLTKYVVMYTADQNKPPEQWYIVDVNISQASVKNCWPIEEDAISVVLSKLSPNAQYTVIVRAATEAGLSNPTIPLFFATKESAVLSYPDVEDEEPPGSENQDELLYKQKLGIALGVLISILCILACVSCIIFRRRCVKRQALARARLAASNNYYPSTIAATYPGTSVQLRHQESCAAEAHEMQHLVGEEGSTHIPPITPTHLDTKGGVGFPNGQLNGTLKHAHMNGHIANGHVHITENPRYEYHDCNGHINSRKPSKQESLLPSLKSCAGRRDRDSLSDDSWNSKHTPAPDESQGIAPYDTPQTNNAQLSDIPTSNSAIQHNNSYSNFRSKESNPHEHRENGNLNTKRHDGSEVRKLPDYNSNCNSGPDDPYKFRGGSPPTEGLNVTQLTCLDDSFSSHRRISPALGPNG